jgi:hypothetical protein
VAAALYHSPSRLPLICMDRSSPRSSRQKRRRDTHRGRLPPRKSEGKPANQLARQQRVWCVPLPLLHPSPSVAWSLVTSDRASPSRTSSPPPCRARAVHAWCWWSPNRPGQACAGAAASGGHGRTGAPPQSQSQSQSAPLPFIPFHHPIRIAGARNISRREQAIRPSSSGGGWAGAARAASSSAGGEWSRRSVEWRRPRACDRARRADGAAGYE